MADPFAMLNNDFVFSQSLSVHTGAVRCLASINEHNFLLSGSIDMTTKLFMMNSDSGKYAFEKETKYHEILARPMPLREKV